MYRAAGAHPLHGSAIQPVPGRVRPARSASTSTSQATGTTAPHIIRPPGRRGTVTGTAFSSLWGRSNEQSISLASVPTLSGRPLPFRFTWRMLFGSRMADRGESGPLVLASADSVDRFCETCGTPLVRNPKHSNAQWAKKRFCERWCAGQRLVVKRHCACGCDETPLPGCKYVKGHRPLKLNNGYRRIWKPGHPMSHKDGMAQEHRVIAYDAGWEVPPGYHVHHKNEIRHDNRLENLEVADHTRLHAAERRPTHCPAGHPYDEENSGFTTNNHRYCKTCNRERARRRSASERAARTLK